MIRRQSARLAKDDAGSAAVEFALVGPLVIVMLLAVLQFGIAMRDYNSLRSASADVARYAAVNYEVANRLTDAQLSNHARCVAVRSPYSLVNARLTAEVATPATQRISGATEKSITFTCSVQSILGMINLPDVRIAFSRPVLLVTG